MYLVNYANEIQSKYYNSMRTPLDVLSHLFFTNGNGYCVEDGNLCEWINRRKVYLKDSYRDSSVTLDDYIEMDERRNGEQEIDSIKQYLQDVHNLYLKKGKTFTETPDFFQMAVDDYSGRLAGMVFMSEVPLEDLFKSDYWYNTLLNSSCLRMIYISKGYYLLDSFNTNTDQDTLKIGLAMCEAYKRYFKMYTSGTLIHDWKNDSIKSIEYLKDGVELLEKNIEQLKSYIKD